MNKNPRHTVLIIEDEANIRNFISRTLELEGFHVRRAADGASQPRHIPATSAMRTCQCSLKYQGVEFVRASPIPRQPPFAL